MDNNCNGLIDDEEGVEALDFLSLCLGFMMVTVMGMAQGSKSSLVFSPLIMFCLSPITSGTVMIFKRHLPGHGRV